MVEKVKKEVAKQTSQFLSFFLANEEYALEILNVKEIRGWEEPTSVPNVEPFFKGVINLRGGVVPIIDLREKFGLPKTEYTKKTVVMIVQIDNTTVGIVVDGVSEVYDISSEMIKSSPHKNEDEKEFISGLTTVNKKMIILINAKQLLNTEQKENITNIVNSYKSNVNLDEKRI